MRAATSGRMTVSSYAVLGLLRQRESSAYELHKDLQRTLGHVCPRSERGVYDEVQWLEQLGLAAATVSYNGRQRRTIYSITSMGRDAVNGWLDQPAEAGMTLESEGLLRVYLALASGPERLRAALDAVEADAAEIIEEALSMTDEARDDEQPGSDATLRWHAHAADFLASYALMLEDWAGRTRDLASAADDGDTDAGKREALELIASTRSRVSDSRQSKRRAAGRS